MRFWGWIALFYAQAWLTSLVLFDHPPSVAAHLVTFGFAGAFSAAFDWWEAL